MLFELCSFVFYNTNTKTYCNCVKINKMPSDDLKNYIRKISKPKLSPFETYYECCSSMNRCIFQLLNPETNDILYLDDIGILLNYLIENGYTIDNDLTLSMKKINNKLICYIKN